MSSYHDPDSPDPPPDRNGKLWLWLKLTEGSTSDTFPFRRSCVLPTLTEMLLGVPSQLLERVAFDTMFWFRAWERLFVLTKELLVVNVKFTLSRVVGSNCCECAM